MVEKAKSERKFTDENLFWIRELKSCEISDDRIEMTTEPGTDLWQRTYYGFRNRQCTGAPDENRRKIFFLCCEN